MIDFSVVAGDAFVRGVRDTGAATAAEYALIIAVVGGLLAMATLALSGSLSGSINESAELIATRGTTGGNDSGTPASTPPPGSGSSGYAPGKIGNSVGAPHSHHRGRGDARQR